MGISIEILNIEIQTKKLNYCMDHLHNNICTRLACTFRSNISLTTLLSSD